MVGIKIHKDSAIVQKARKRIFTCYLCGSKGPTAKSLNDHFRNVHESLHCPHCNKEYYTPLSLKKHVYEHTKVSYVCSFCDKTFPFMSQKDFHERIHMTTTRHHCNQPGCTSSFSRESDLKSHKEMHTKPPIQCEFCTYTNRDIRNVRQHERTHMGEKPYVCHRCGKDFTFSQQRLRHKCKKQ